MLFQALPPKPSEISRPNLHHRQEAQDLRSLGPAQQGEGRRGRHSEALRQQLEAQDAQAAAGGGQVQQVMGQQIEPNLQKWLGLETLALSTPSLKQKIRLRFIVFGGFFQHPCGVTRRF